MIGPLPGLGGLAAAWATAALLLAWPSLPARWRRVVAVLVSTAGVVFLVLGARSEGFRESPTLVVFMMGEPYATRPAWALASLPFYVMTVACLALGTAGLAVSDRQAQRLLDRPLAYATGLSLGITAVRFALEKAAAPPAWAEAVGITWLAPLVGAYFALTVLGSGGGLLALVRVLFLYGLLTRGAVAAVMTVASTLRLGTHYDVSPLTHVVNPFTGAAYAFEPGSPSQLLHLAYLPQLGVWPLYTVAFGLVGAALVRLAASLSKRRPDDAPIASAPGRAADPGRPELTP